MKHTKPISRTPELAQVSSLQIKMDFVISSLGTWLTIAEASSGFLVGTLDQTIQILSQAANIVLEKFSNVSID